LGYRPYSSFHKVISRLIRTSKSGRPNTSKKVTRNAASPKRKRKVEPGPQLIKLPVAARKAVPEEGKLKTKSLPRPVAKRVEPPLLPVLLRSVLPPQKRPPQLASATRRTSRSYLKETAMSATIDRRDDVNPEEGERKYGDVEFADSVNNKYPIDTAEHVRAAWRYISQEDNAAKYDRNEVETIKGRIKKAAKKFDVEIS
jgi:hypothetical protein